MNRHLSRRNILRAAGILAGGSTLGAAVTASTTTLPAAGDSGEAALPLFRQWIATARELDQQMAAAPNEESYSAEKPLWEIEDQIVATAGGAVTLALKTFFAVRQDHATWAPDTATLAIEEAFADEPYFEVQEALSRLRDAAKIVPEIADLAAPVLHADAPLIDAEIGIRWCRDQLAEPQSLREIELLGEERRREIADKLSALLNRLASTEAKTERGLAIKDRERGLRIEGGAL